MRLLPRHFRLSWVRHWSQCWCDTNCLHFADDIKRATCDVTRHGSFTQHERQAITKTWKPFRRWESKKILRRVKKVFDDEQRLTRHDGRVLDVGRVTSCVRVRWGWVMIELRSASSFLDSICFLFCQFWGNSSRQVQARSCFHSSSAIRFLAAFFLLIVQLCDTP